MNLLLVLVTWYLYSIQVIDSKKYRMIVDDEIQPYTIEEGVSLFTEYFSLDHLILEQIDDDKVKLGQYVECIKSLDPKLPLQLSIRSQYLHQSSWREGPLQIISMDVCPEHINPSRFWYNISKLWTNCPPQKGEKWVIETQIVDISFDLPPSIPIGNWRFYCQYSQALFGSVTKFGYMMNVEFIYV